MDILQSLRTDKMACLAHARVQNVRLQTARRHRTSAVVARAAFEPAVSRRWALICYDVSETYTRSEMVVLSYSHHVTLVYREIIASLVSAVAVGSLISVGPAQARDFKAALAE